jgi:AraC-like DNA-binding protein
VLRLGGTDKLLESSITDYSSKQMDFWSIARHHLAMAALDQLLVLDPLSEVLRHLRMEGVMYCRSEFSAPWGLSLPAMEGCVMFHAIAAGRCWLDVPGSEPRWMQTGDFVLATQGQGHRLCSKPRQPAPDLFDLPREQHGEHYEVLRHGGGGEPTIAVCGAVRFDDPLAVRLIASLPSLIAIEAQDIPHLEWFQSSLRFMATEARQPRAGSDTVITRLADILVIQAIRHWMGADPAAHLGWLGALRDRAVGAALMLMHRDPARNWTLASLAGAVALSRSAFAARFAALVGMPPLQYLTQWRMQLARTWLRQREITVAQLAEQLGYESEAAFSRAFKRWTGMLPSEAKRAGRSAVSAR